MTGKRRHEKMRHKNDKEKLIDQIKSLPKINDTTDKDTLYRHISSQIDNREKEKGKKFVSRKARHQQSQGKVIPIFSAALVIVILLIMLPSVLNQNENQLANEPTGIEKNMQMNKSQNDVVQSDDNENVVEESNDDQNTGAETTAEDQSAADSSQTHFTLTPDDNMQVVYGAVAEPQLQYVIPFSVVVSKSEDIENVYNQLDEYIKSDEWGVAEYPLADVTFTLNLEKPEVSMDVPTDFRVGEGSARANMLESILTHMFSPYEINNIQFSDPVDFGGHIGSLSEMPLYVQRENYKIYQAEDGKREFLIPIPQEEQATLEQAFDDMKNAEESYHISETIPEDIDFTLETNDSDLVITFAENARLDDEPEIIIMLEAMLMTAKSYGFEHVTFEADMDHIGRYKMNENITVPEAINPIN